MENALIKHKNDFAKVYSMITEAKSKTWLQVNKILIELYWNIGRSVGTLDDAIKSLDEKKRWLPRGIQSLTDGSYNPRCLKRYYFADETVDQLHLSDRIFQHILLKQLKPTFKHVMNKNCYHLDGPTGVKYATQRIKQVLLEEKPNYLIRADIKSFYRSIPHYKLIQDIKKHYSDPKVLAMLENIITNPIDAPRGYKNPVHGIALRGPLSQFFSALYLKPLDDAFDKMDVTYVRFQDDLLILCKTKRQFNRCRRRMMEVLHERHLAISRTYQLVY